MVSGQGLGLGLNLWGGGFRFEIQCMVLVTIWPVADTTAAASVGEVAAVLDVLVAVIVVVLVCCSSGRDTVDVVVLCYWSLLLPWSLSLSLLLLSSW